MRSGAGNDSTRRGFPVSHGRGSSSVVPAAAGGPKRHLAQCNAMTAFSTYNQDECSYLDIARQFTAIGGELRHDLLVQPNIHSDRVICIAGIVQFFGVLGCSDRRRCRRRLHMEVAPYARRISRNDRAGKLAAIGPDSPFQVAAKSVAYFAVRQDAAVGGHLIRRRRLCAVFPDQVQHKKALQSASVT
jgi:hypothetical protein